MLDRLSRTHSRGTCFVIFTDEAHHCYSPGEPPANVVAEENDHRKNADVLFPALESLHSSVGLERVFHLSATPMWLHRTVELSSDFFPWTVADSPLLDSSESGLTKIPPVPVADDWAVEGTECLRLLKAGLERVAGRRR